MFTAELSMKKVLYPHGHVLVSCMFPIFVLFNGGYASSDKDDKL